MSKLTELQGGAHTPTPWKLGVDMDDWRVDYDLGGSAAWAIGVDTGKHPIAIVVTTGRYDSPVFVANANLIVQAVNSHAALVEALTEARKVVAGCIDAFGAFIPVTEYKVLLTKIDAALTLANGGGE